MEEVHEATLNRMAHEITQKRTRIYTNFFVLFSVIFLSFVLFRVEAASAASLYISPSSGTYAIGKTISVSIYVSSPTQAMNAVSGIVSFPPDKLEVNSLTKTGSVISLWVQEPTFTNSVGTVNFEGVVLNPGFTGQSGKVLTINFRAKSGGIASLSFSSGSVLANDGKGTNILAGMAGASYTIQSAGAVPLPAEEPAPQPSPVARRGVPEVPVVSSSTHPEPEKWYSNNSPEFSWDLAKDITGVSFLITNSPTSKPGGVSDGLIGSKKFEGLADDIWYFHIKLRNNYGWGEITHRKVLIDTVPPDPFKIEIQKEDPTDPHPILFFKTIDKLSGIEYYEIKIGQGDVFPVTVEDIKHNPYKMPAQAPGKHAIEVKAYDRAKNYSLSQNEIEVLPIETPIITKSPNGLITGQIFALEGKSLPENKIIIFLLRKGLKSAILLGETKADEKGIWSFSSLESIEKGDYEVWVQAQDKRGALSLPSQKVSFWSGLPPFLRIGKIAIDYLTVMITLIVLIIGGLLVVFYAWYRISLWRKRIRKETKEVDESVTQAFRALRDEVEEQVGFLDKKPGLSKGEKEIRDKLAEALNVSEKFIRKELKDIEKEAE